MNLTTINGHSMIVFGKAKKEKKKNEEIHPSHSGIAKKNYAIFAKHADNSNKYNLISKLRS